MLSSHVSRIALYRAGSSTAIGRQICRHDKQIYQSCRFRVRRQMSGGSERKTKENLLTTTTNDTTAHAPFPNKNTPPDVIANSEHISFHSFKSFTIGSFAGLLGSLAGMGGGFVMIPLMTSKILRLTQHQAHGTSLFAVAATGMAGALGYGFADVVDIDSAAGLALGGMITARLGAGATSKLSPQALKRALGIFMILVSPVLPAKQYIADNFGGINDGTETTQNAIQKESNDSYEERLTKVLPIACIGLGSGFLAGMFGVGGGAVVVPALTIATDMNHYQALGTSLCAMSLPAIVGTVTHFQKGNVIGRVAVPLAFGSFLGAYFGGRSVVGLNVPEEPMRYGFSALMFGLGTKTLLKV